MVKQAPAAGSSSRSADPALAESASHPNVPTTAAGEPRGRFSFILPTRWREFRRPLAAGVATLVLAVLVIVLIGYFRAKSPPEWWVAMPSPRPQDGEKLEHYLVSEGTRVRSTPDVWAVEISEGEINNWLAGRLSEWARSQGRSELAARLGSARVRVVPGEAVAGLVLSDGTAVWSASLAMRVSENGLEVLVTSGAVGKLAIPTSWIADGIAKAAGVKATGSAIALPGNIKLGDGRRVQLTGIECLDGVVVLACRTIPGAN